MLVRYADGSPDFRMDVLVVVKHIAIAKMFWRTCMKWHYSPDLQAESRTISNGRRAVDRIPGRTESVPGIFKRNESVPFWHSSQCLKRFAEVQTQDKLDT